jgi:hypothetical protein
MKLDHAAFHARSGHKLSLTEAGIFPRLTHSLINQVVKEPDEQLMFTIGPHFIDSKD